LLVWSGLIFLVTPGVAGWWLLAGPAGYHWLPEVANWATGDSASLAEPGPATAGTSAPPGPARPTPPGGGIGDDPVMALEAFAGLAGDPALAAELRGIAAALRRERQAREEERGRAAATAIAAGAQLARVYRRDAADLRRLETAAGVCGEDAACRQRYGPALARAATARELTRDAYVRLLGQIAADYPQELLDRQLGAAAPASGAAARGNPDEAAALDDLAQRFVDQVARRRDGTAGAEPETVVGELLVGGPPSPPPEPLPLKQGSEP
jgi:hypothetical protein